MMPEEMPQPEDLDFLGLLVQVYDISLKTRILRRWQQASRAREPDYSERDILILTLAADFSPVTEGELRSVFGLSPSSISEVVRKLADDALLDKAARSESDQRVRPLTLTKKGRVVLKAIRESGAARYAYLFSELGADQLSAFRPVLKDIDKAASLEVRRRIFDEYA